MNQNDHVSKTLEKIQLKAGYLNDRADEATAYIEAVEEQLRGVGVDIPADMMPPFRGEYGAVPATYSLGYGKAEGINQRTLHVRVLVYTPGTTHEGTLDPLADNVSSDKAIPLLQTDRATRINAVHAIPELLKVIDERLDDELVSAVGPCSPEEPADGR